MLSPLLLFVGTLLMYIHNLSPSVYGGDIGDLVSAVVVRGVAHPSGYPLYTMLGILFNAFPLVQTSVYKVGLMSAFFGALTISLLYIVSLKLTKNTLLALLTSITLAFFYQFWLYAELAEVFILNAFFAVLLFFLAFSFSRTCKKRYFYLFSLTLGFSFSHHQTIILVLPALTILLINGLIKSHFALLQQRKVVGIALVLFLMGLLPYAYLPFAAAQDPPINWNNPTTLENFFRLILRKDYGTFSAGAFISPNLMQRFIEVKGYAQSVFSGFTIAGTVLIFLGMIRLFLKDKFLFFVLFIAYLISGPLFIFYAGFPITNYFILGIYERFFILSSVFFVLFLPFGIQTVVDQILKRIPIPSSRALFYKTLFTLVFFLIPISLFLYNYPKTNLSNIWVGDNLGYDLLTPLPKDAVVFLAGDTPIFNSYYVYYALGVRPDITIVNLNVVMQSSYFTKEYEGFIQKNKEFEKFGNDAALATMVEIAKKRPVFSMHDLQFAKKENKKKKLTWIPIGLVRQLSVDGTIPPEEVYTKKIEKIWSTLHTPILTEKNRLQLANLTLADIKYDYIKAAHVTGSFYFSKYSNENAAQQWYKKALAIDPAYAETYKILGSYYFQKNDCKTSAQHFAKAIELNRSDQIGYFLLYNVYVSCLRDKEKAKNLQEQFYRNFGVNFLVAAKRISEDYKLLAE